MNVKDPVSRLLRWRIQLEEYDCEIVYKPGVQNSNADAVSRIGTIVKEEKEIEEIDSDFKIKILQENHDLILGGHRGMNKTCEAIRRRYQWTNMKREVKECVKKDTKCQVNKTLGPERRAPMKITTTANTLSKNVH
jgi:hypothetical protein